LSLINDIVLGLCDPDPAFNASFEELTGFNGADGGNVVRVAEFVKTFAIAFAPSGDGDSRNRGGSLS